jgi:3-vinyl bacteriochlorophyllide hydratase
MHHQLTANRTEDDAHGQIGVMMPRAPGSSHHPANATSSSLYNFCNARLTFATDPSYWAHVHAVCRSCAPQTRSVPQPLYTPEQKRRRDETRWTLVQGILAPLQFVAFAVSLGLVLRYLATGEGLWIATASILIKTLLLYAIMVTGAIWERVVFGRYLFAHAFFWEDVFSILVLALHTAYLVAIVAHVGSPQQQMMLVLAAYASYAINATQFLLKLRAARLQHQAAPSPASFVVEAAE